MTVYANGRAIIHRGDGHRQISGTPDVCKTPSPAGPVPIPYPNLASDSDLAKGSKNVKIANNPAALQSSNLKTSTGDEAGTAGGGLMSSKTKGKVTWTSSSSDVRIEGKNSVRFLDICLHNGNMANSGGQATNSKGTAPAALVGPPCLHCGLPTDHPTHSHANLQTDNDSLMKSAVNNDSLSGHMKGGIKVGDQETFASSGRAIDLYNLASNKKIEITQDDIRRMKQKPKRKFFNPGNCAEQHLLDKAFPFSDATKSRGYPPPGGKTIKMGIAKVGRATQYDRIKKPQHEPKCAVCEEVMIAMLCTNPKPSPRKT